MISEKGILRNWLHWNCKLKVELLIEGSGLSVVQVHLLKDPNYQQSNSITFQINFL
jgi:hypothetical protein